jgi:predicted HTH transcriptional regulator
MDRGMMMTDQELESLLNDLESDRVERKESISEGDKIRQAICAFASDLPDYRQPGVLFIGANDRGEGVALPITDQLLKTSCRIPGGRIGNPSEKTRTDFESVLQPNR